MKEVHCYYQGQDMLDKVKLALIEVIWPSFSVCHAPVNLFHLEIMA